MLILDGAQDVVDPITALSLSSVHADDNEDDDDVGSNDSKDGR